MELKINIYKYEYKCVVIILYVNGFRFYFLFVY